MTRRYSLLALLPLLALAACDSGAPAAEAAGSPQPAAGQPTSPEPSPVGKPTARTFSTDVMIFTGDGSWATEISDAEALLSAHGASFQEVNSAQLDTMSPDDIAKFGVFYMPGGEGATETASVSAATHSNLREAVQQLGVSYVGFCAGAWVAVAPAPAAGQDASYGFGIVNGPVLDLYAGPGSDVTMGMTQQSYPDGSSENVLWYGGPVTPSIGVVEKYPNGQPSVSQMWSGKGLVIIGGNHPDISKTSLDQLGVSPDSPATDFAWKIFNAAITQQKLPTF